MSTTYVCPFVLAFVYVASRCCKRGLLLSPLIEGVFTNFLTYKRPLLGDSENCIRNYLGALGIVQRVWGRCGTGGSLVPVFGWYRRNKQKPVLGTDGRCFPSVGRVMEGVVLRNDKYTPQHNTTQHNATSEV